MIYGNWRPATCRECGEVISAFNGRRYCSDACRQRAYRARRRRVTAIAVTEDRS